MIVLPDDYHAYPHVKELADRVMADAGVNPMQVYELWLDEGGAVLGCFEVRDARMINGRPVITYEFDAEGRPARYRMIRTRHGWVREEGDDRPLHTQGVR